jgi:hypothetical protein
MEIVYSPFSCALARGGNEACETLRCCPLRAMRGRVAPPDGEDASPNKVNSFRPRYTKSSTANLPEMVKPATGVQAMNACVRQVDRGEWRERVSKEQSRYPGDPSRSDVVKLGVTQRTRGTHNSDNLRGRKSEWPVLALMRSNVRGAEGLHRYCVSRLERSSA